MNALSPVLTPHGRLLLERVDDEPASPTEASLRLEEAFARGHGHGLLQLGAGEVGTALPPALGYWREFAARYVTAVCMLPNAADGDVPATIAPPPHENLESLAAAAPLMTGAEYLTASVLHALWETLDEAFHVELSESKISVQGFLERKSPAWHLVGRVHFNL